MKLTAPICPIGNVGEMCGSETVTPGAPSSTEEGGRMQTPPGADDVMGSLAVGETLCSAEVRGASIRRASLNCELTKGREPSCKVGVTGLRNEVICPGVFEYPHCSCKRQWILNQFDLRPYLLTDTNHYLTLIVKITSWLASNVLAIFWAS